MEYAVASGISLQPVDELNPMKATGYGFGQLMQDALKNGVNNFVIGIGGSATVDGGSVYLPSLNLEGLDIFIRTRGRRLRKQR